MKVDNIYSKLRANLKMELRTYKQSNITLINRGNTGFPQGGGETAGHPYMKKTQQSYAKSLCGMQNLFAFSARRGILLYLEGTTFISFIGYPGGTKCSFMT